MESLLAHWKDAESFLKALAVEVAAQMMDEKVDQEWKRHPDHPEKGANE